MRKERRKRHDEFIAVAQMASDGDLAPNLDGAGQLVCGGRVVTPSGVNVVADAVGGMGGGRHGAGERQGGSGEQRGNTR